MREDLQDIVDVTKQQQQQRARSTHKNESVATKHRSYSKRIGLQFTKRRSRDGEKMFGELLLLHQLRVRKGNK